MPEQPSLARPEQRQRSREAVPALVKVAQRDIVRCAKQGERKEKKKQRTSRTSVASRLNKLMAVMAPIKDIVCAPLDARVGSSPPQPAENNAPRTLSRHF
ncbi:hypothetical protein EVAR_34536_1 [Eumeta japonica]|uniref:Uncharacterized protein n=1 Tax=Eumeta variegata TaxID=151549 RepID=A0A4C1X872_EUMVA|nr:hypothetical protein EVAR_34536_1 [Eumeta japonica]